MKLFVGNLAFDVTDEDLRKVFEPFGTVMSAAIVKDRFSSEPRGFGFVEMSSKSEAQAAINELNGKDFMSRAMAVNEARPMPERPRRDFNSFSRGRGGHDSRRRNTGKRGGKRGSKPRFGGRPH
ncbi:MAG: RNA-binding protein [Candidatus Zixiibacteriota bacterium]